MTEIRAIVDAFREARAANVPAALATVVRVEGSGYRRPGARMLITETGTTGLVSGGCLDGDISERARRVMRTQHPVLARYDTRADDDAAWGLGLGCNGVIDVLIEPAGERVDRLVRFLEASLRSGGRAACATVIRSEVRGIALGDRSLLCAGGAPALHAGELAGRVDVRADLQHAVRSGRSSVSTYDAGGPVECFVEAIEPRVPMIVFGAGADVLPLITLARQLGWHTTVVDTRARSSSLERFESADAVLLCRPENIREHVTLTPASVAVVMTHDYLHDRELLRVLLDGPARYIGCLGPRRRTERLLSELPKPASRRFAELHAPVGLDIGAETPAEVALSIAAEILSASRERSGGPLRRRRGSIHGAEHAAAQAAPSVVAATDATSEAVGS